MLLRWIYEGLRESKMARTPCTNNNNFVYSLDPVGLVGEGQYNLNNLKEVTVTDSFLGLEKDTRHCQNIETYHDCKTRVHIENLRQECGCLPLSLKLLEKVNEMTLEILTWLSISFSI